MPVAHPLLDALDPEQRAGRRGAARAGPGAGRRRHRQDPGDHPPDRVRRRHRRLRADRGARGHVHDPRRRRDARAAAQPRRRRRPGPHLPLRGAAPAALLLAAGLRHRAADADRVQDRPARRPPPAGSGCTPTRRCCATSPPRSSGPRSATSTPTTTPGSPRRAAASSPARTPRPSAGSSRLRGGQARPGPDGHGGRPAAHRRPARRRRAGRRAGPPPVQVVRRRRVPGRLARSSRRCSTCGSAAATSSAWSATRRRRSTPSPAPTPTTCATSRGKHPGTTSIELVRNYRSTPEVVDAANTLLAGSLEPAASSCAPSARPARRSPTPPRPDEVAEAEAVAAQIARLRDAGRALGRGRGPVPHQRPVRGVRGGAVRARHPVRRPRRRPLLRPPRGPRGGHPAPRRRPVRRGRRRRRRIAGAVAAILAGMGWTAEAPTARGQTRDRWESWQALVDQAAEFAGRRRAPT